jgi:hypothetical protein
VLFSWIVFFVDVVVVFFFILLMVLLQFRLFSPRSALSITQFNELFLPTSLLPLLGLPMHPSMALASKKKSNYFKTNQHCHSFSRATKGADIFSTLAITPREDVEG